MKKIKDFFEQYLFSTKVTFQASREYYVYQLILTVMQTAVPFVSFAIWRSVINILVSDELEKHYNQLLLYLILYLALYIVSRFLSSILKYITYRFDDRISIYIENLIIEKYKEVDLAFFDSSNKADKLNYIQSIKYSMTSLSQGSFSTLECVLTLGYSFIMLCTVNIPLAFIAAVLLIPIIICKTRSNRLRITLDEDTAILNRKCGYFKAQFKLPDSIADIKLFKLKDLFIGKFTESWEQLYKRKKKNTVLDTLLLTIELVVSNFAGYILLYGTIIYRLGRQLMLIGDATYMISIYGQFDQAANSLINTLMYMQYSYQNMLTVREFLDMKPDVARNGEQSPTYKHKIEFSHVSFKYPGSDHFVLNDCSFIINSHEVVGLVGENGSGKSTIVNLLLRLYDVTSGQITIDDVDIRECDINKYRALFGVLFQDYVKYSLTLRESVALSNWDRRMDNENIYQALEMSGLHDTVSEYEEGLETQMTRYFSQSGKELSGGQWQRLALARVFFNPHDFIILDEPSASLDVFAEENVFRQFREWKYSHSTLIISHRLSSIVDSDKILVLKDGMICEMGSHAELMQINNGYYRNLFRLQAQKYMKDPNK